MKKLIASLMAVAMLCAAGVAFADCGKCGDEKKCSDGAKCASGEACCKGEKCAEGTCPIAKAMAALPKLTYTVGSETACCEASAKAMAKKAETHMHYVVGEKEFDAKDKAMLALADATDEFVTEFATPHTCSVSGKTSVCGNNMACKDSAAAVAEVAKGAMKKVSLAYKVGDKTCNCPNEAAKLAKESGAEKHFVIGEEETSCEVDARIKLARAKYMAAVKAIAETTKSADQKTEPVSTTTATATSNS